MMICYDSNNNLLNSDFVLLVQKQTCGLDDGLDENYALEFRSI